MFSSKDLFFTTLSGYRISNSLRFRSSASAYLNRSFGSGSTTAWTWSGWVKRGYLGSNQTTLFFGDSSGTNYGGLYFSSDVLSLINRPAAGVNAQLTTTQVFRDPSAWYHIVAVWDTANSTSGNRLRLYVNGSLITAFTTATYPAQNTASVVNTNIAHEIGATQAAGVGNYLDGYLADINFIDGQALTPSSFGAYDTNGVWQPAQYTGTYGTNGFYLPFSNTTSTTTLVADSSGNGNNWTPNNISLTAGVTYDSMIDSPTNYADGGNGRGNYATLNATTPATVSFPNGGSLINANLSLSVNANVYTGNNATIQLPSSGKWYWEGQCNQNSTASQVFSFGVASPTLSTFNINQQTGSGVYWWSFTNARYLNLNGTNTNTASTYTAGTVVMAAYDADTQKLYLGIGGTWYSAVNTTTTAPDASGNPVITTNLSGFYPAVGNYGSSNTVDINFGQRPFTYTPPSGYSALNTQNLTTPTITNGAQYMAAVTYTGTGSSQTITTSSTNSGNNPNGTTFQPDFVWAKGRSGATDHALYDAVRGVQLQLESNTTTAETTETTGLTAFTSSGFTTGALAQMNTNTATYVAWEWNAGGSNATNTTGSIQSTVRANTTAGFSVVTFTCPASGNFTVGHGLGVTPNMIIVKSRSTAANNWCVAHSGMTNMAAYFLQLNTTIAQTNNTSIWANTAPTSSVFSMGTNVACSPSDTAVAYCFAAIAGYSAFGSYTGNGSADGPFVYTGFRPRYVLVKLTSAVENWYIQDSSRGTYNANTYDLFANLSNAEQNSTAYSVDFLSNGFKLRTSDTSINTSSGTYIYVAFAENPFKISRAR